MMQGYLTAKGVGVRFSTRTIIEHIDFTVQKGEFWSILGPNGSGKTTFLKTIGGWLPYFKGDVLLEGESLKNMDRKKVARKIGMVSVEEGNNSFTVEETVFMGRFSHLGRFASVQEEDIVKVRNAMQQVGVYDKCDRLMSQLSQGERQKVWVARALAQDVDLLLMDEPTSHLDVRSQSEVFVILEKLCRSGELAVIAILHDINLALAFSSHLMLLQKGEVKAAGEKDAVADVERFSELYQIPFELEKSPDGGYWAKICYK